MVDVSTLKSRVTTVNFQPVSFSARWLLFPETYDWVDLAEPLERCVEGSFVVHEGEDIMQLGSGGALRAAAVIHGTETKMGRFFSIWLLNSLPWKDPPFLIGKAS